MWEWCQIGEWVCETPKKYMIFEQLQDPSLFVSHKLCLLWFAIFIDFPKYRKKWEKTRPKWDQNIAEILIFKPKLARNCCPDLLWQRVPSVDLINHYIDSFNLQKGQVTVLGGRPLAIIKDWFLQCHAGLSQIT